MSSGPPERDEDEVWAEIVASFDSPAEEGETPWPEEEELDAPEADGEETAVLDPPVNSESRVVMPAYEDDAVEDDDDDHYVPPPPPPLPRTDAITMAAWLSLFGGPVYLVAMFMLQWPGPRWADFLAVAAFVGGLVTLVLRMSDEPRDPDDGAVV